MLAAAVFLHRVAARRTGFDLREIDAAGGVENVVDIVAAGRQKRLEVGHLVARRREVSRFEAGETEVGATSGTCDVDHRAELAA